MKRIVTACVVCSVFLTMVGMLGCKNSNEATGPGLTPRTGTKSTATTVPSGNTGNNSAANPGAPATANAPFHATTSDQNSPSVVQALRKQPHIAGSHTAYMPSTSKLPPTNNSDHTSSQFNKGPSAPSEGGIPTHPPAGFGQTQPPAGGAPAPAPGP